MRLFTILAAVAAFTTGAAAADLSAPKTAPAPVEDAAPAKSWTGCYGGVFGGIVAAGMNVEQGGADLGCDYQINSRIVLGGVARYGHTFSPESDRVEIMARAGLLLNPALMVYATGGGMTSIGKGTTGDWYGMAGAGLETYVAPRLTLFVEADRYFETGAEATSVLAGVRYRFGSGSTIFGN